MVHQPRGIFGLRFCVSTFESRKNICFFLRHSDLLLKIFSNRFNKYYPTKGLELGISFSDSIHKSQLRRFNSYSKLLQVYLKCSPNPRTNKIKNSSKKHVSSEGISARRDPSSDANRIQRQLAKFVLYQLSYKA